jgi:hypothetical protein
VSIDAHAREWECLVHRAHYQHAHFVESHGALAAHAHAASAAGTPGASGSGGGGMLGGGSPAKAVMGTPDRGRGSARQVHTQSSGGSARGALVNITNVTSGGSAQRLAGKQGVSGDKHWHHHAVHTAVERTQAVPRITWS